MQDRRSREPIFNSRLWPALGIFFCAFVAYAWYADNQKSPEQRTRDAAASQERARTQELETQRQTEANRRLCRVATICTDYSKARQACATAGQYGLCMQIKLGDTLGVANVSCLSDGGIRGVSSDEIPNRAVCWALTW